MKQFCKASKNCNLKEAVTGIVNPKGIIMLTDNDDKFANLVKELEELFPGVPSISCVASGYTSSSLEGGLLVVAFSEGVEVASGVIQEVTKAPVKYIEEFEKNVRCVKPGKQNTVVIDFCTGNDAVVLNTIAKVLNDFGVELMGGTASKNLVGCNGVVYTDADVYLVIKNNTGKAKVYKENIYEPIKDKCLIASDTERNKYYVGKFNGKSSKQVYMDELGISEKEINTQTFKNPLGKMEGNDICIISLKEVQGNGICCYRQINDSDILTLLQLRDYEKVINETKSRINADFDKISGFFSVNCIFRYLLFKENKCMESYLCEMSKLNNFCGFVGNGEHFNSQFINQTMTCVVFE